METAPSWGIEPVPERLWVLGVLDGFLLWANLSVSLLVIVAGAFLVLPGSEGGLALSLPLALGAIGTAAVVGNLMLGVGGYIGADARVPQMVLLRAPLGHRGSYLPTALNILQCLGWSVFELIIIATGASASTTRTAASCRTSCAADLPSARLRSGHDDRARQPSVSLATIGCFFVATSTKAETSWICVQFIFLSTIS